MKKYSLILLLLSFVLPGCDNDTDPGGTAVQKMAGDWIVNWLYEDNGTWEDALGGEVLLTTYNTAANVDTEMFLHEQYLINTAFKVSVNYSARTFDSSPVEVTTRQWGDVSLTISNGKVLEGAATTPRGMPADSIVFFIDVLGDTYKISGFRRTGFEEDE